MPNLHHHQTLYLPLLLLLFLLLPSSLRASSQTSPSDASALLDLLESLHPAPSPLWAPSSPPCSWPLVACSSGKVTALRLGNLDLSGVLPPSLGNLTSLSRLELQNNRLSGALPSLRGLSSLQTLLLHGNRFTALPPDFFTGLTSLQSVSLDDNPFDPWQLPDSLRDAVALVNFSANAANLTGTVPDMFADKTFPSLNNLALAYNYLHGPLPTGFSAGSPITTLWLNNQRGRDGLLSGPIDVVGNMTNLVQLWLHSNNFSGPLPEFGKLGSLQDLELRDNRLTGPVPQSLMELKSLRKVTLTNNLLQGPVPVFGKAVETVEVEGKRFCLKGPGECDPRVTLLLQVLKPFGYPERFAEDWTGNDPCTNWLGISCDRDGSITLVNFKNMSLEGTISPDFSLLVSLQKLLLSGNRLTGTIPESLANLTNLNELDLSGNLLYGRVPEFHKNVLVLTDGNPGMVKDAGGNSSLGPAASAQNMANLSAGSHGAKRSSSASVGAIVGAVVGAVAILAVIGLLGVCLHRRKKSHVAIQSPNAMVIHPRFSGSDPDFIKITVAGSGVNGGTAAASEALSRTSSSPGDVHVVESGSMVISIQVLRNVTNNFSEDNVLGRGGFGTVYRGELHDGTKIAVKRMESGVIGSKALEEFRSEISVLTKVRHRHLVSLLGYCLDGNERLLVYEYMPQGTLSRYLFNWKDEGLRPLEWKKRLSIALDVARGVEYLHSLAHQSFIHRDLKPSNILLGDDMKAKVADFGLVRLAPDGKCSVETKLAGTFGYLAPEYAVTGRVTTKADVFSFGVILMELISGRKALDESQPEESIHLVTWFRRMQLNKESFHKAIDPSFDIDEETMASINTVAKLAGHCCAREPYQRPDMGHAVNVLSSLAEMWKPTELDCEESYGIDLNLTLPQALKKWQSYEGKSHFNAGTSSYFPGMDDTQTSIPTRPPGFAYSFTSADGR